MIERSNLVWLYDLVEIRPYLREFIVISKFKEMIRITSLYLLDPLRKHLKLMGSPW